MAIGQAATRGWWNDDRSMFEIGEYKRYPNHDPGWMSVGMARMDSGRIGVLVQSHGDPVLTPHQAEMLATAILDMQWRIYSERMRNSDKRKRKTRR